MIDILQLQLALAQRDRSSDLLLSVVDHGFAGDDSDSNPAFIAWESMLQRLSANRSPWFDLWFAFLSASAGVGHCELIRDETQREGWRAWLLTEFGSAPGDLRSVDVTETLRAWLAARGRALPLPSRERA